jgi:hypothetical protein
MKNKTQSINFENIEIVNSGILGTVFSTEKHKYFYDTISSKILKVQDILFDILEALTESNKKFRIKKLEKLSLIHNKKKIIDCLSNIENHKKQKGLFRILSPDFKIVLDRGDDTPLCYYNR